MSKQFKLKPKAVEDLENIYNRSINIWGVNRTREYIYDIENIFFSISENPMFGHAVEHLQHGLRSYPIGSHIVFYRREPSHVVIVRILHKSMDYQRHLS